MAMFPGRMSGCVWTPGSDALDDIRDWRSNSSARQPGLAVSGEIKGTK